MLDLLSWFVPPGLAGWSVAVLLAAGAFTAFLTTVLGIGGGVLLLGVMSVFLPAAVVIPLHGVIQLGANAGRTMIAWRRVRIPVLLAFLSGAVVGAAAGAQVLVELPRGWMELLLGAFILWACLGPTPRISHGSHVRIAIGGTLTSALTLFVGATGPLVGALIRALRLDRRDHVSTFAACMVSQHGLKVLVFWLIGFGFGPYAGFLAAIIACSLLGVWLGGFVLERLQDRLFHRLLTALLVVLALRLVYVGGREVLTG